MSSSETYAAAVVSEGCVEVLFGIQTPDELVLLHPWWRQWTNSPDSNAHMVFLGTGDGRSSQMGLWTFRWDAQVPTVMVAAVSQPLRHD